MPLKTITCLNGAFIAAADAMLPVADRGFRFGDGVFETLRLEMGVPYQWAWHMQRLGASLAAVRIASPVADWAHPVRALIAKNAATEGFIRIAISRGVGSRGYVPTNDTPPHWVIEYLPPAPPQPAVRAAASLWVSAHARIPLACLPGNHKLAHGLGSTLALLEARDHGCDEALQLTPDGMLCEAASANLFWVRGSTIFTPSLPTGCLNGSTRTAILRLSSTPVREVAAPLSALHEADSVFLTNCRVGVWPVASIAPLGIHLDAYHPALEALSAALTGDRTQDARTHRALWA